MNRKIIAIALVLYGLTFAVAYMAGRMCPISSKPAGRFVPFNNPDGGRFMALDTVKGVMCNPNPDFVVEHFPRCEQ